MDFIHDALADGRTLRVLTIVDTDTRECLAATQQPALSPILGLMCKALQPRAGMSAGRAALADGDLTVAATTAFGP